MKLARSLFPVPEASEHFLSALQSPQPFPTAILWTKERPGDLPFETLPRPSWLPPTVDLVHPSEHPGKHPLHEQGAYYVLDASSVFAASVLLAARIDTQTIPAVLDMCSSPGGKGIFCSVMLEPDLLICNEVIGKRTAQLISNLKRCEISPVTVTSSDSKYFAESLGNSFPVVMVDAPCSGQSLIAKGRKSPGCFHSRTISMNSNRQKRVLACSAKTVAPGGYLAYMTCTYSREENENVVEWLLERFPEFQVIAVPALEAHRSPLADFPCYRMWPQDRFGAGAFTALLKHVGVAEAEPCDIDLPPSIRVVWRSETTLDRTPPRAAA